jgi:hypothetical protein
MLGRRVREDARYCTQGRSRAEIHNRPPRGAPVGKGTRRGYLSEFLGPHGHRCFSCHQERARGIDIEEPLEFRKRH